MKKKYLANNLLLTLVMIIPLLFSSVSCAWTFYDNPITEVVKHLQITLGKFNFTKYPNEYPDTDEGVNNQDMFDKVIGGQIEDGNGNKFPISGTQDGISLSDPSSAINKALESTNLPASRPYLTSDDYFDSNKDGTIDNNDMTVKEYFYGKNAPDNFNFVIVRETYTSLFKQTYSIYTSTVDLSVLNVGDKVQYVYKTQLLWTKDRGFTNKGSYEIVDGNVRGTCTVIKVAPINNKGNSGRKKKLFDYSSFM